MKTGLRLPLSFELGLAAFVLLSVTAGAVLSAGTQPPLISITETGPSVAAPGDIVHYQIRFQVRTPANDVRLRETMIGGLTISSGTIVTVAGAGCNPGVYPAVIDPSGTWGGTSSTARQTWNVTLGDLAGTDPVTCTLDFDAQVPATAKSSTSVKSTVDFYVQEQWKGSAQVTTAVSAYTPTVTSTPVATNTPTRTRTPTVTATRTATDTPVSGNTQPPLLSLTKSGPGTASAGEIVHYQVRFQVRTPAVGIQIQDVMIGGLTVSSSTVTVAGTGCNPGAYAPVIDPSGTWGGTSSTARQTWNVTLGELPGTDPVTCTVDFDGRVPATAKVGATVKDSVTFYVQGQWKGSALVVTGVALASPTPTPTSTDTATATSTATETPTSTATAIPVNDPPSFTSGGNVSVAEDSGSYSAPWATSISPGPPDESWQTVQFIIQSNSSAGLFTVAPSIAPDGTLSFTSAANANGLASLSVVAQDNGGTANGGQDTSAPVNFNIAVTAVDDPPMNTVPGAQTVNEDTDLVFSTVNGNGISVSDIDVGSSPIKVSLGVLSGTLTLPTTSGLTFVDGTNNGQATVHFTGTLTDVNVALDGLKYRGNLNFNSTRGSETLVIVSDDQGNTGSGGPLTATSTVDITVNAVNDPPVAAAHSYSAQANMKISLSGLLSGATDPDTGDVGYTAVITVATVGATSPAGGNVTLTNASTGAFDFDPPPGVTGIVTFTYTVCDNGSPPPSLCSDPATVTVNVSGPVIWFVNPAAAVDGDGRLSSPFQFLSGNAGTNNDADDVDALSHRIFLYSGTSAGGITLNANEWLIGQGVTDTSFDAVFGITPPTGTIARPSIGGTRPIVQNQIVMGGNGSVVRGLNIQPSSGTPGLTASGAMGLTTGQVSVSTSNAVAVSLTGGTDGTFSFESVSANGGTSGIVLNNVNTSTGSFTVSGKGSLPGTGGLIQNTTDSGILATNTANLSLSLMNILNNGNAQNEGGIRMTNVFGTGGLTSTTVRGSSEDNIYLSNNSGTLTSFTIQGPGCSIASNSTTIGNAGVTVLATGTSNMTVTVDNCMLSGNRTDAIHTDAADTSVLSATISNNTIIAGSGGANQGNIGIEVTAASSATVTYDVNSNKVGTTGGTNAPLLNTGINVFAGNTSSMSGKIRNNTVYNAGGGFSGYGIRTFLSANATLRANISSNTVNNVGLDYGLLAESSGATTSPPGARMDVAVTGNTVNVLSTALDAIRVQARNSNTVCARINTNTTNSGGTGFFGIFARLANITAAFLLEGLTGPVDTYLQGQNLSAASVGSDPDGGSFTSVAAGSCNIP